MVTNGAYLTLGSQTGQILQFTKDITKDIAVYTLLQKILQFAKDITKKMENALTLRLVAMRNSLKSM